MFDALASTSATILRVPAGPETADVKGPTRN
ncbi:hypothetical protein Save01_07224 [Streptomyces avermitilis]